MENRDYQLSGRRILKNFDTRVIFRSVNEVEREGFLDCLELNEVEGDHWLNDYKVKRKVNRRITEANNPR